MSQAGSAGSFQLSGSSPQPVKEQRLGNKCPRPCPAGAYSEVCHSFSQTSPQGWTLVARSSNLLFFFSFKNFFGCSHSKGKFRGQGLHPQHSSNVSHSTTTPDPGTLTCSLIHPCWIPSRLLVSCSSTWTRFHKSFVSGSASEGSQLETWGAQHRAAQ